MHGEMHNAKPIGSINAELIIKLNRMEHRVQLSKQKGRKKDDEDLSKHC